MSVLDEILETKRDEVTVLHQPATRDAVRTAALAAAPPRDFVGALHSGDRLAVIAEIKRRSPSKGDLAPDLDAAATAAQYAAGGAACLSVLTDRHFFGGSVADLQEARAAAGVPVLRKDFVIDPDQVYETRGIGADAVLLIVAAIPDDGLLRDLHELAGELGIGALVEAHDDAELERALAIGAQIVGVNARDLGTFAEDLGTPEQLAARIPASVLAVAESAIRTEDDARRMADAGYDAVLVGEGLVRTDDPTALVRTLATISRQSRD